MSEQNLREKVIKGLEYCAASCKGAWEEENGCPYMREWLHKLAHEKGVNGRCVDLLARDALALLKAQEPTTVEPKRIELANETKEWLDKMDAVDALGNIADICIDWDGYRTADGLGGLVNEIWAYARYCAYRIAKTQEPVEPAVDIDTWKCGNCGHTLEHQELLGDNVLFHEQYNYCPECGATMYEHPWAASGCGQAFSPD